MGVTSGAARAAAGAIALAGWAGLALQFSATFDQNGSVLETLWIIFRYFTVLTNLLLAMVLTGVALGRPAFGSPGLLGGATLAIVLVGVVYSLLLRGMVELSGGARLADFLLHDMTPVLTPAFWLLFAPKGALRIRDPFLWVLYPLAYLLYALVRGAAENRYAYPFMDVPEIGWLRTAINALLIMLSFLAGGFALVWLDRVLRRRAREE
jgi:hypothetical protein